MCVCMCTHSLPHFHSSKRQNMPIQSFSTFLPFKLNAFFLPSPFQSIIGFNLYASRCLPFVWSPLFLHIFFYFAYSIYQCSVVVLSLLVLLISLLLNPSNYIISNFFDCAHELQFVPIRFVSTMKTKTKPILLLFGNKFWWNSIRLIPGNSEMRNNIELLPIHTHTHIEHIYRQWSVFKGKQQQIAVASLKIFSLHVFYFVAIKASHASSMYIV